jgi:hypothetical protein
LLLGATVCIAVGGAIAFGIGAAAALPDGPVAVVWDKAACAQCSMHVGEPAFAAQLTAKDGRTLFFDDPGCLLTFLDRQRPDVHAIWFRHRDEDRWLPAAAVAFATVPRSPMGYGLQAVDPGTPGALTLTQAQQRCRTRGEVAEDRR